MTQAIVASEATRERAVPGTGKVRRRRRRTVAPYLFSAPAILLYLAFTVTVVLGTLVIFTFDPCPSGAPADLLPSFCTA